MNRVRKVFCSGSRPMRAVAAMTILLFLTLIASAALPGLHHAFHADAKDAHHHCAITLLAQGQVDAPACDISVALPSPSIEYFSPLAVAVASTTFELLPPGRAPPLNS